MAATSTSNRRQPGAVMDNSPSNHNNRSSHHNSSRNMIITNFDKHSRLYIKAGLHNTNHTFQDHPLLFKEVGQPRCQRVFILPILLFPVPPTRMSNLSTSNSPAV